MAEYIIVKKSQVSLFKSIPFYYQTQNGEYALYKKKGDRFDEARLNKTKYPDLYILDADRETAMAELIAALNKDFEKKIAQGKLKEVRETLEFIVEEALAPGQEKNMNALPETLDILLGRYQNDNGAMEYLRKIESNSSILVKHTVNVTALTLQFCFFHDFSESDTRQLAMAALIHDVGCSQIDKTIIETSKRLTDKQFKTYTTHPKMGHDMIIQSTDFDMAIPKVVLEHHERIDGSGYPNGLTRLASYSQLIGLIDSYESLTYRGKAFRKVKKPFASLSLIKEEVLQGKFSKELFKRFASCLGA
ncbi:MAG: HD domain-containing protein [Desulfobacteraceae bacterium]|nr:HD domain-containing protein [Desulfobacteraceae bacterium]